MGTKIKKILKSGAGIKINGSLWFESETVHFFGPGPVELLELIEKTGSINMAAKEMKMSYKKAWELISNLNTHTNTPVIVARTGGEKGGGSTLTDAAYTLISYHRELRERFSAFLENESEKLKEK